MKKLKSSKKLTLHKATVRHLSRDEMATANGGSVFLCNSTACFPRVSVIPRFCGRVSVILPVGCFPV